MGAGMGHTYMVPQHLRGAVHHTSAHFASGLPGFTGYPGYSGASNHGSCHCSLNLRVTSYT